MMAPTGIDCLLVSRGATDAVADGRVVAGAGVVDVIPRPSMEVVAGVIETAALLDGRL